MTTYVDLDTEIVIPKLQKYYSLEKYSSFNVFNYIDIYIIFNEIIHIFTNDGYGVHLINNNNNGLICVKKTDTIQIIFFENETTNDIIIEFIYIDGKDLENVKKLKNKIKNFSWIKNKIV